MRELSCCLTSSLSATWSSSSFAVTTSITLADFSNPGGEQTASDKLASSCNSPKLMSVHSRLTRCLNVSTFQQKFHTFQQYCSVQRPGVFVTFPFSPATGNWAARTRSQKLILTGCGGIPLRMEFSKTVDADVNPDVPSRKEPSVAAGKYERKQGKPKVIVISGPTASGKTRLGLMLADLLGGEIISADSVQVYKGLNVGSAKTPVEERQGVPHHLLDILDPTDEYTAGDFYQDARSATEDVLRRGKVPIVVGGTGLYLRWYLYGKPDTPRATPEIVAAVERDVASAMQAEEKGWDAALALLAEAGDPLTARQLARNDWYRLRRALEIVKATGRPRSSFSVPSAVALARHGPASAHTPSLQLSPQAAHNTGAPSGATTNHSSHTVVSSSSIPDSSPVLDASSAGAATSAGATAECATSSDAASLINPSTAVGTFQDVTFPVGHADEASDQLRATVCSSIHEHGETRLNPATYASAREEFSSSGCSTTAGSGRSSATRRSSETVQLGAAIEVGNMPGSFPVPDEISGDNAAELGPCREVPSHLLEPSDRSGVNGVAHCHQSGDLDVPRGSLPVAQEEVPPELDYDFRCFFLSAPRVDLYRRIDLRCEEMVAGGMLQEAAMMLEHGVQPDSNPASRAIGYRQALEYLQESRVQGGQSSEEQFLQFLGSFQQASRNLAKRQTVWFRSERLYRWLDASLPPEELTAVIMEEFEKTASEGEDRGHADGREGREEAESEARKRSYREGKAMKTYRTELKIFSRKNEVDKALRWVAGAGSQGAHFGSENGRKRSDAEGTFH